MSVLTEMNLYLTGERIVLHPVSAPAEMISIDRLTNDSSLIPYDASVIALHAERTLVYGIMGTINLIAGPYLIVITAVSRVGTVYGQAVWRVDQTQLIPYCKSMRHLTEDQVRFNQKYFAMITSVLDTEYFYFCTSYDLSHTLQRLSNQTPDFATRSLFDRADERFVWNKHLLQDWNKRDELKKYCLPVIHGFVSIQDVLVNGFRIKWILISRRHVRRAGCRLFMRGADADGNPANYVETEQMIEYQDQRIGNGRCSFVQIRGSIPIYWSQTPNLKYKPPPLPLANHHHADVLKKHVDHVTLTYGPVVMISLINHTGAEGKMEKEFAATIQQVNHPLVKYESFDFHHECRKMRWDRLSILMERLARDQAEFGFFHAVDGNGSSNTTEVLSQQEGIFRTNCIDSLDRTNVLQGLIARRSLELQLRKIAVLSAGESIKDHSDFENIYRNVWADNADIISIQYSGTGALKTDFTRTGKRTVLGALRDGYHSLSRYYKNNLTDGFRQDAIDLFLGNYHVHANEGKTAKCPLDQQKDWKYMALPLIVLGSIAMFFFSILLPHEHSTETFIYLCFWFGMISISLMVIVYYGKEFVDFPKLRVIRTRRIDKES